MTRFVLVLSLGVLVLSGCTYKLSVDADTDPTYTFSGSVIETQPMGDLTIITVQREVGSTATEWAVSKEPFRVGDVVHIERYMIRQTVNGSSTPIYFATHEKNATKPEPVQLAPEQE